jgi:hypothetical protein
LEGTLIALTIVEPFRYLDKLNSSTASLQEIKFGLRFFAPKVKSVLLQLLHVGSSDLSIAEYSAKAFG